MQRGLAESSQSATKVFTLFGCLNAYFGKSVSELYGFGPWMFRVRDPKN